MDNGSQKELAQAWKMGECEKIKDGHYFVSCHMEVIEIFTRGSSLILSMRTTWATCYHRLKFLLQYMLE